VTPFQRGLLLQSSTVLFERVIAGQGQELCEVVVGGNLIEENACEVELVAGLVVLVLDVGLVLAFAGGGFVLIFAFAKESVPAGLAGTVSGIANMGVMMGGMLMQPLVGVVLDARWDGRIVDGVRIYDFTAYQWGFSLLLAWGAVSLVLLAAARETNARPIA